MTAQKVKESMFSMGAELCGIASADRFHRAPRGYHPRDVLPGCKSVLVFAKRFLKASILSPSQIPYTIVRNILSDEMDRMSLSLCTHLERHGILAVPTGTIGPTEQDPESGRSRNIISVKHAAELAGLGRIGKNSLLITPELGNMVWLSAVVTNAELESDALCQEDLCPTSCRVCIDACPVHALQSTVMNQAACWDHAFGEKNGVWQIRCNQCRVSCPRCCGTCNRLT